MTSAYQRDIDGLRALAIFAVVCFHALPKTLSGGFAGVDIFFVISEFLISSKIHSEITQNKFEVLGGLHCFRKSMCIWPSML